MLMYCDRCASGANKVVPSALEITGGKDLGRGILYCRLYRHPAQAMGTGQVQNFTQVLLAFFDFIFKVFSLY